MRTSSQHAIALLRSEAGDVFVAIVIFCLSAAVVDHQTLQLEFGKP